MIEFWNEYYYPKLLEQWSVFQSRPILLGIIFVICIASAIAEGNRIYRVRGWPRPLCYFIASVACMAFLIHYSLGSLIILLVLVVTEDWRKNRDDVAEFLLDKTPRQK